MAAKFLVVLALAAGAHSSVVPAVPVVETDNDNYSFSYNVADPNTGDYKSHSESRVGGTVKGQYSLLDADGTIRIVDYTADVNGFNAVVRKEPANIAKVATPAVVSAPILSTPLVNHKYIAKSVATPSTYTVRSPSFYAASPSLYSPRAVPSPYYYPRSPYTYSSYDAPLTYW